MRRWATGAAVLILVLLAIAAAAPVVIGPAPIVQALNRRVVAWTGRPVTVAGPVSWRVLPTPSFSARGLHIANIPGGSAPDLASAERIEARLAFWPLLTGRIDIGHLTVQSPSLNLEVLPDGRRNWVAEVAPTAVTAAPSPAQPPRPPTEVRVREILVTDGAISISRPGQRVAADGLAIRSEGGLVPLGPALYGPAEIDARFREAAGLATSVRVLLGSPGAEAKRPFSLEVAMIEAGRPLLRAVLDGSEQGGTLRGWVRLASAPLGAVWARLGVPGLPHDLPMAQGVLSRPVTLRGYLQAGAGIIDVAELDLTLGHTRLGGHAAFRIADPGRPDLDLTTPEFAVDELVQRASPEVLQAPELPAAPAPVPAANAGAADPSGAFRLTVGSLGWRGYTLRDIVIAGRTDAPTATRSGRIHLDQASAALPGSGRISAAGTVDGVWSASRFSGSLAVGVPDLRALLATFAVTPPGIAGRFAGAALKADLTADRHRVEATRLDLTLDRTHATGHGRIDLAIVPRFQLRLAADELDLDAYLGRFVGPALAEESMRPVMVPPLPAPSPEPHPPPTTITPLSRSPKPRASLPLARATSLFAEIARSESEIDLLLGHLIWRGLDFHHLHLAGQAQSNSVTIDDASVGDVLGAHGALAASLRQAGLGPELKLSIDAAGLDFGRILRAVWHRTPRQADASGPFHIHFTTDGGLAQTRFHLVWQAIGAELTLDAQQRLFGRVVGGTFSLTHPSFAGLIAHLTRRYRPAEDGPASLAFTFARQGSGLTLSALSARAGVSSLRGSGSLDWGAIRPRVAAGLTDATLDLDRLLPPVALPRDRAVNLSNLGRIDGTLTLSGQAIRSRGWHLDAPDLAATLGAGTLTLQRLGGRLLGGAFAAAGTATAGRSSGSPAEASITASLSGADWEGAPLPLGSAAVTLQCGHVDGEARLQARGNTIGAWLRSANGTMTANAGDGIVGGIDLAAAGRAQSRDGGVRLPLSHDLKGGATPFDRGSVSLLLKDGIAAIEQAGFQGRDGQATARGTIDLGASTLDAVVELDVPGMATPVEVPLKGPLDQVSFGRDRLGAALTPSSDTVGGFAAPGGAPPR